MNIWKELHDEYGQLWWAVGLPGLILFMGFLVTTFVGFLRNITDESIMLASSVVVFLVMCIPFFPMRTPPLAFYGLITVSLLINVTGGKK